MGGSPGPDKAFRLFYFKCLSNCFALLSDFTLRTPNPIRGLHRTQTALILDGFGHFLEIAVHHPDQAFRFSAFGQGG